jgi:phage terminase large subunit-like protein
MSVDAVRGKNKGLVELAEEDPLGHPALASLGLFEYEYHAPPFLREIMGSVYKALEHPTRHPRRLARLYPREHGKSETGSHVIPSWAALRNPDIRVIILMESETKAKEKLRQCRNTIADWGPRFGRAIEEDNATNLTLERSANHAEPTIAARGMDSKITGGHYDVLVFDDIVSWPTQRTETQRQKRWSQFQDYQQNLGSEGESVYLVLGTRKHSEDLYSELMDTALWDVNVRKAITDYSIIENGEYSVQTDAGNTYSGGELSLIDTRNETIVDIEPDRDVDVLWPERWPLRDLIEKLLSEMQSEDGSALVFKRENQNDPRAMEGQVLTQDMLHYVPPAGVPDDGLRFLAGVDVAVEDDAEKAARGDSDWWSVSVVGDHRPSNVSFLVELERKRGVSMKRALGWIRTVLNGVERTWGQPVSKVLVESNQAQRWLVQEAREEDIRFHRSSSSGSKEERVISMASRFEAGRVKIVDQGLADQGDLEQQEARKRASQKWQSFTDEWVSFPTGSHDDRLDATEIALRGVSSEEVTDSEFDMSDLPT